MSKAEIEEIKDAISLLPEEEYARLRQKKSKINFELLKNDTSHPSLRFKRVGKLWSIRVGSGIGHWPLKTKMISFGFGLALMTSRANGQRIPVARWNKFPYATPTVNVGCTSGRIILNFVPIPVLLSTIIIPP